MKARAQAVEGRPEIEYPAKGETIVSPTYTIRVGAPASADAVDVSIDLGPWRPCRKDAGYWWYDWAGYADGEHDVIARIRGSSGRWRMSAARQVAVATTV
ncbi:MAG TPA: hypothetical protein VN915_05970 [Elusimicrobiota bacterium]|nr:hypothetical protein [Elusimicrobiota bacterium]